MVTNLWNEEEADSQKTVLEQRVYSSQLLGQCEDLVLHGGGNTSVKDSACNLFGEREQILLIKGSGASLARIEATDFACLRLAPLLRLRELDGISDSDLTHFLATNQVDPTAPSPSVEVLLHAFLPHRFVDHTHAKAILTLTNQASSHPHLEKIFGKRVGLVPYLKPGFQLATAAAEIYQKQPVVDGLILMKHGIFTFGESAREAYQKMIELVEMAEQYLRTNQAVTVDVPRSTQPTSKKHWMQALRREYLGRGFNCILSLNESETALALANHPRVAEIAKRGPISPDYVIRIKPVPLILERSTIENGEMSAITSAFDKYAANYQEYFTRHCSSRLNTDLTMNDPLPRAIIAPALGIVSCGQTLDEARLVHSILEQSAQVMLAADRIGTFEPLTEEQAFEMEYWEPQRSKLRLGPAPLSLTGKIAVVTGGAGGIGLAITREFLSQGAVVFILDINEERFPGLETELASVSGHGNKAHALKVDVTCQSQVSEAFSFIVESVGGVDIVVANAGVFTQSSPIEEISTDDWKKSIEINLNGAFHTIREAMQQLKTQAAGGDIVVVASKNVPAPGRNAAAYSVSKAAQTQLARVSALEGGPFGIRVNILHPHLIFDTAIWSKEVIEKRALAYGMTPEQYMKNNLLKTTLCSADVAKAAFALVGGLFSKTTGAQIPIDGGSDRTL